MPRKGKRITSIEMKEVGVKGKTMHSPTLSIRTVKRDTPTTYTVVVSKKVERNAVGRNKIKRRIREILKDISLPQNTTIVVYSKKGITQLSFQELKKEIKAVIMTSIR